jgi:hypothetical protein
VFRLGEAIRDIQVPQTFDGRPPSRAFATENVVGRLLVGERYELPSPDGPVFGELMQGIVIEPEQAAMGIFRLDSGQYVTGQFPLSSAEVAAYRESPETFFGVPQEVSKRLETGLDAYEWVLAAYRHTPKARLLELLRSHPQFHELQSTTRASEGVRRGNGPFNGGRPACAHRTRLATSARLIAFSASGQKLSGARGAAA